MRAWTFPGERLEARFFSPDVPKPQPTPTPATDTTAIDEAEARERAAIRKRRGRAATTLTNRPSQAGTLLSSPAGAPLGQTDTLGTNTAPARLTNQRRGVGTEIY